MKKYQFFIGVDVSKKQLDLCVTDANGLPVIPHLTVANHAKAIAQMLKQLLRKLPAPASEWLFCLEHTGVYTMPLSCALAAAAVPYTLVSGLQIHRSLGIKRGKSDKADAADIARYARLHQTELTLYQLPEKSLAKLRALLTHRDRLVKAKLMLETVGDEVAFMGKELMDEVVKSNNSVLRKLDKSIDEVNEQIQALIQANEQLKTTYQLLVSIPGVGPQISCYLLVFTRCFTTFQQARQLACYAGIAPFEYSSGSSIRGRTRVNHLANKKLKTLLNLGALNAKRADPELRLYFERKVAEGKNKMLVLNAIRNKLVARIFATVQRGTPYVPVMQFAA